jgi:hypothetical protein
MLAAMGYSGLEKTHLGRVRLQRLFDAVILLALVFNLWQVSQPLLERGVAHYLRGITYRDYYLQQNLGWYQIAVEGLRELPPGSRTLLLYETRSLYCLPHCTADDVLDRWTSARLRGGSDDETFRSWRAEGFTHILVNLEGMRFLIEANDPHHPKADITALTKTLSELPMIASYGNVYGLYSLP